MASDLVASELVPLGSDSAPDTQTKDEATDSTQRKTQDILEACKWRNLEAIKALAGTTGGFLTDTLRRKAC